MPIRLRGPIGALSTIGIGIRTLLPISRGLNRFLLDSIMLPPCFFNASQLFRRLRAVSRALLQNRSDSQKYCSLVFPSHRGDTTKMPTSKFIPAMTTHCSFTVVSIKAYSAGRGGIRRVYYVGRWRLYRGCRNYRREEVEEGSGLTSNEWAHTHVV